MSCQPAPILPTVGGTDDADEFLDAASEHDARECDDKDTFYINDLNGVAALEGLDGVRSPPDPLPSFACCSAFPDYSYDTPVDIYGRKEPIDIRIAGCLRHWYVGIADVLDVVDSSGTVVGRSTGADAITAGHDLVTRFYELSLIHI